VPKHFPPVRERPLPKSGKGALIRKTGIIALVLGAISVLPTARFRLPHRLLEAGLIHSLAHTAR
jgi:hypothetical protein